MPAMEQLSAVGVSSTYINKVGGRGKPTQLRDGGERGVLGNANIIMLRLNHFHHF